ncbi:MAG TPA: hypothetical protein VHB48_10715 [Chitinophagaceae bacterium]|nr:hypothetical protein [Chitinophagaceae bacterium]
MNKIVDFGFLPHPPFFLRATAKENAAVVMSETKNLLGNCSADDFSAYTGILPFAGMARETNLLKK